jgi:hypothetical protein
LTESQRRAEDYPKSAPKKKGQQKPGVVEDSGRL